MVSNISVNFSIRLLHAIFCLIRGPYSDDADCPRRNLK